MITKKLMYFTEDGKMFETEGDAEKHQKSYERELKSNDKVAYEAYMQGKKDAYSEQHDYCSNHHCNHSYYYHNHARFYYHYEYRRQPKARSSTSVKVGLPRVKIGLF